MKMVSQLTRQALNRHLILSSSAASHPFPKFIPESVSAVSPTTVPPETPSPALVSRPLITESQPPRYEASPRPRTIYQQLMNSHDRMTERHLPRT